MDTDPRHTINEMNANGVMELRPMTDKEIENYETVAATAVTPLTELAE